MTPFHQCFTHFTESPTNAKRQGKEINGIWIWKEEIKLSLSADDMIFYVENVKELTK